MNPSEWSAFLERYRWPSRLADARPLAIGHRGACALAVENTLASFRLASLLGAEMWELDTQLTRDGVCVVSHDDSLLQVFGIDKCISDLDATELGELTNGQVPAFSEVAQLAQDLGAGLYVELKAPGTGPLVVAELLARRFTFAAIGSFQIGMVRELRDHGCTYPLAVLIRLGDEPFRAATAAGADIVHLCWERGGSRPQDLVIEALLGEARRRGLAIVLWHEERADVIADLKGLPVAGICSDRPHMLRPFKPTPHFRTQVCLACDGESVVPENTIAAARFAAEMNLPAVTFDVRDTRDGVPVIFRDATLERTTNGHGRLADKDMATLGSLDAGGWFSAAFRDERIPTLAEVLAYSKRNGLEVGLDFRDCDIGRVMDIADGQGMFHRCFFSAGEPETLLAARQMRRGARIVLNRDDFASLDDLVSLTVPDIVAFRSDWPAAEFAACRARGIKIMIDCPGTDEAMASRALSLTPDYLTISRPDMLIRLHS